MSSTTNVGLRWLNSEPVLDVMSDQVSAARRLVAQQRAEDSDSVRPSGADGERQSVSVLVRSYGDQEGQKRDRSESGDSAPAGKRGARDLGDGPARSPAALSGRGFKSQLDDAIDGLESRLTAFLSRELHELRVSLTAELDKLNGRVKDLERHVEERDNVIEQLSDDLRQSRAEVSALQTRVEEAEINSRLPCIILSGAAMAPPRSRHLEAPLPASQATPAAGGRGHPAGSADSGQGQLTVTSQSADHPGGSAPGQSGPAARGVRGRSVAGAGEREEREDVNGLVIRTLNQCMSGLNITTGDIDRAHRLPGPNNRVIVRFIRSGEGSVRDQIMARRLELRGRDLFVNESLTKLRGQIFRSLLAAKREKKIYTVYSRGGHVFFKEQQYGVGKRVDSLQRLSELGYSVLER